MTAAEIVRTRLLGVAGVTALAGARIYNGNWPQAPTHPSIRVNEVGSQPEGVHLRGADNLPRVRVQVDCCAATLALANQMAAAVQGDGKGADATGLHAFTGDVDGVRVDLIRRVATGNQYMDQEHQKWVRFQDYEVHFRGVM